MITLKGAGGDVRFETVNTVLPEHVPVYNGVCKLLFPVTAFEMTGIKSSLE